MTEKNRTWSAIVLAAGMSTRMGQPKMVLPWLNGKNVIQTVVQTLNQAGVDSIVVVTGGADLEVRQALSGYPCQIAYNNHYANGEMLVSLKTGLAVLHQDIWGTLVSLGDQPQIEDEIIHMVLQKSVENPGKIIFPSFQKRRGHPWLIPSAYFEEIRGMEAGMTMRDFIKNHSAIIEYVSVNSDSIMADMDTPDDYQRELKRYLQS